MKTQLLKFTVFLLILSGIAASCNPEPPIPEPPIIKYPIEVSFTEYSLSETSCQWINLTYNEKLIIINSNEELEKYIACTDGDYPAVDFNKNSLLIASGIAPSPVSRKNCRSLQQFSEQNYIMEVGLSLGIAGVASNWQISIIIDKLNGVSAIELIVKEV